ncbi:hypothetical protein [Globicatella sanguinis]
MIEIDKELIIILAMVIFLMLSVFGMVCTAEYLTTKLETEQPKYFIEFKGSVYELREVEVWTNNKQSNF